MYHSLNIVDPGKKKRKLENYHIPGRHSRHPDSARIGGRRMQELLCIKGLNIVLVYKARIYDSDTRPPIDKINARVGMYTYSASCGRREVNPLGVVIHGQRHKPRAC